MIFVTLQQVKDHLKIDVPTTPTPDPADADLILKVEQAEAIVLDYLEVPSTSPEDWTTWTDRKTKVVTSVVLMLVTELYRFRGDDPGTIVQNTARDPGGSLSPVAEGLLRRLKPLALA